MSKKEEVEIAVICKDIDIIKRDLSDIKEALGLGQSPSKFVTQVEYYPVKSIVYGLVSTVLLGVLGAIIAFITRKQ